MSRQVLTTQLSYLESVELEAFARLVRAHTLLRRELEAETLRPRGLTHPDFEVLLHLYKADDHRLRRIDLVERVMLTASGITRLLDGLQADGLVRNIHCPGDARVTWAQLTEDGVALVEDVGVSHARRLQEILRQTLSEEDVSDLSHLLGKLPGVGAGSCAG